MQCPDYPATPSHGGPLARDAKFWYIFKEGSKRANGEIMVWLSSNAKRASEVVKTSRSPGVRQNGREGLFL